MVPLDSTTANSDGVIVDAAGSDSEMLLVSLSLSLSAAADGVDLASSSAALGAMGLLALTRLAPPDSPPISVVDAVGVEADLAALLSVVVDCASLASASGTIEDPGSSVPTDVAAVT